MWSVGFRRATSARGSSGITGRRAPRSAAVARRTRVARTKGRKRLPRAARPRRRAPDRGRSGPQAGSKPAAAAPLLGDRLTEKFKGRTATVAVIGLGYVGLPLACEFARGGFTVAGIDTDASKISAIRAGRSHVQDVPEAELRPLLEREKLRPSPEFADLERADAAVICVPTPLRKTRDPDISYIVAAVDEIARYLHPGLLVVLESTTYPGTTEEVVLPKLESSGLKVGQDFFLAFSPERVDPGNTQFNTRNTPKIVGGVSETCGRVV